MTFYASPQNFKQSTFDEITVDTALVADNAFHSLLTRAITTSADFLLITISVAFSTTIGTAQGSFRITVDGVAVRGSGDLTVAAASPTYAGLRVRVAVTAGVHTVALQGKTNGGFSVAINPVSDPSNQHATLICEEVAA